MKQRQLRINMQHIPTGDIWYGESTVADDEKKQQVFEHLEKINQAISKDKMTHLKFHLQGGSTVHFSSHMLRECVFIVENM